MKKITVKVDDTKGIFWCKDGNAWSRPCADYAVSELDVTESYAKALKEYQEAERRVAFLKALLREF